MTDKQIYQKLVAIIEERKGQELDIHPALSLKDDLQVDSVDLMEFILTIEDTFGLEISDEEIDDLQNIQDILDLIERKTR
ncbi:phosphopantetheine-binding protein [Streptococcus himalayensis]|uniref:Acyl carrier protein n=1 Tax=Streptococcus himalayensis TaxID=1888195 RepID=A0A917EGC5_9STRE|nr:phosphopantetheine-binding protein [Streptococcus himalayensis]GGE30640.1 acyl carrier protein [Streptococcus himalayensis]